MRIYENFTSDNYIDDDIPAVCIGGFDGVHLGHQELLKFTKEASNLFQIVTFDILPKKLFNNEHKLLTTCLLYTSPSPRDPWKSRMPSSA